MSVSEPTSVPAAGAKRTGFVGLREYVGNIGRAIMTTFEGLAVTSSWLFRRPLTVQYPDRVEKPVQEQLPKGYRGVLEVDLLRCSGCLLCARACPIDCIAIKVEKNAKAGVREIVQFDIDIGKCMFCGLCVEACKFEAIAHTPEFEATTSSLDDLVLRFAETPSPVAKLKEGEGPPRKPLGSIVAHLGKRAGDRPRWSGLPPDSAANTAEGGEQEPERERAGQPGTERGAPAENTSGERPAATKAKSTGKGQSKTEKDVEGVS